MNQFLVDNNNIGRSSDLCGYLHKVESPS